MKSERLWMVMYYAKGHGWCVAWDTIRQTRSSSIGAWMGKAPMSVWNHYRRRGTLKCVRRTVMVEVES